MSQRDASGSSGDDASGEASGHPGASTDPGPQLRRAVGWALDSGAAPAVGATAALVAGLRALRRGDRRSALVRLLLGGVLGAAAVVQRRSAGPLAGHRVEESDVVDTAPDVADVEPTEREGPAHATGDEASEVVDTAPDLEAVEADREAGAAERETVDEAEQTGEAESTGEAKSTGAAEPSGEGEGGAHDVLGAAAFDAHSGRVPAPQVAFNRGLLSAGEVHWGVREADDAVLCSLDFDAVEDPAGIRYVGSSEIEQDERDVRIPDAVTNHWDNVAGGGTAVTSGTDIVFATSEDLAAAGRVLVVPEQWRDEVLGGAEETGE